MIRHDNRIDWVVVLVWSVVATLGILWLLGLWKAIELIWGLV